MKDWIFPFPLAMPDQPTPPRDSSLIIVTGALNPLVHTPQFYRSIGAMDEEQLQASLKVPTNITTAAQSQFQFANFKINCEPGQWWIHRSDLESWDRMLKITGLIFGRLGGTPMSSYALAAQRHMDTPVPKVKTALVEKIAATGLGFPNGESLASSIELVVREEDFLVTAAVQPSVLGEQLVYGYYQRQYPVPVTESGHFVLEPTVRARLAAFSVGSQRFFDAAVAGVSSTEVNA